jgi:nitrate reductase assembly molybdenum cofactor insertion protein NarJ
MIPKYLDYAQVLQIIVNRFQLVEYIRSVILIDKRLELINEKWNIAFNLLLKRSDL